MVLYRATSDDALLALLLACREGERLRQFGELVNTAKEEGFIGYDEVQELLQHMAKCLGPDISEQGWYKEVRCMVDAQCLPTLLMPMHVHHGPGTCPPGLLLEA